MGLSETFIVKEKTKLQKQVDELIEGAKGKNIVKNTKDKLCF